MTTIAQTLHEATTYLTPHSPTPRLDAEILLAHTLYVARTFLLAERQHELSPQQLADFRTKLERRAALEPIAYIVGHKEFYGLDFAVDRRVLVPRPETELLVEIALGWTRRMNNSTLTIADIGTGSGCLAVTLAVHLPAVRVFAVDLSADALQVARTNAERHGVAERVTLLQGDGCAPLPQPVDLIVANPPYTVMSEIDENVRRWEPHLALDGGAERGFVVPYAWLRQMPDFVRSGGLIAMEIGAWQGAAARAAAYDVFPQARIELQRDLAGLDRVLSIET